MGAHFLAPSSSLQEAMSYRTKKQRIPWKGSRGSIYDGKRVLAEDKRPCSEIERKLKSTPADSDSRECIHSVFVYAAIAKLQESKPVLLAKHNFLTLIGWISA